MQMIRKTSAGEVKALDDAQGIVVAYVNTLDTVDYDGEIIAGGAFDKSLARKTPSVCWFHDQRLPIGKVVEAHQEQNRLLATMQFNLQTQRGREAFADVAFGSVTEWSVGFYAVAEDTIDIDGRKRRRITECDLVEISAVIRGASPETGTIAAKDQGAGNGERGAGDGTEQQQRAAVDPPVTAGAGDPAGVSAAPPPTATTKERSYEEIRRAIEMMLNPRTAGDEAPRRYVWVIATYAATAIVCREDAEGVTYWRYPYSVSGDDVLLGTPTQVEQTYTPVASATLYADVLTALKAIHTITTQERAQPPAPAADDAAARTESTRTFLFLRRVRWGLPATKVGARNAAADQRRIQAVHDAAVELGAACAPPDDGA